MALVLKVKNRSYGLQHDSGSMNANDLNIL